METLMATTIFPNESLKIEMTVNLRDFENFDEVTRRRAEYLIQRVNRPMPLWARMALMSELVQLIEVNGSDSKSQNACAQSPAVDSWLDDVRERYFPRDGIGGTS